MPGITIGNPEYNIKENADEMEFEDYWEVLVPEKLYNFRALNTLFPTIEEKMETIKQFPQHYKKIISIIHLGYMGSGASTTIRFIAYLMQTFYKRKVDIINLAINEIVKLNCENLKRIIEYSENKRRLITISDTEGGFIPREYTIKEPLKQLFKILKEINGLNILFLPILNLRPLDFELNDRKIKKTIKLIFIKSYYERLERKFKINEEDLTFLKEITHEGMVKRNYEALKFCLVITSKKEVKRGIIIPIREDQLIIKKV